MDSPQEQLKNSLKKTDRELLKDFFFPSKRRWFCITLILVIYIFFHIYILKTNEIKLKFWKNFVNNIQALEIGMLSFLITGYAIFQAFLSEKTLTKLLEKKDKGSIYFVRINKYFYCLTMCFLISMLINLCLINILDKELIHNIFVLFPMFKNEVFQLALLLLYLLINIILIFDIKSFLKNIHDIFVINAYYNNNINEEKESD